MSVFYVHLRQSHKETCGRLSSLFFIFSLGGSNICVCNMRCLEDCAPEAGQLMTIVDLYNVELLHDARIQTHFLCLKAREDLLAKVDS